MTDRPLLAVSLGDPCGVGPEVVLRLLAEGDLPADLLLVGDRRVLERDADLVPGIVVPPAVAGPDEARRFGLRAAVLDVARLPGELPSRSRVEPKAGRASYEWVAAAARLAAAGTVDALVTGPIHKGAWAAARIPFPGHTEALRAIAGVPRVLMLMVGGPLRVALATVHEPLARVPGLLTTDGLVDSIRLLGTEVARRFGPDRPRLAVAGLNPHAGEAGLFGTEDRDVIAPAVERARSESLRVEGPLPADACIPAAAQGRYDAVLAMYHDQGLTAVKTLAPRTAVNVTLGLPFVRTSVDHGTAFDIAGRGMATASSLRAAVALAATMVRRGEP